MTSTTVPENSEAKAGMAMRSMVQRGRYMQILLREKSVIAAFGRPRVGQTIAFRHLSTNLSRDREGAIAENTRLYFRNGVLRHRRLKVSLRQLGLFANRAPPVTARLFLLPHRHECVPEIEQCLGELRVFAQCLLVESHRILRLPLLLADQARIVEQFRAVLA